MRTAYIVAAVLGALYFLLKKRRFDFLAIGYFSALIYFLPAWYGTVRSWRGDVQTPIVTGAYAVMFAVITAIFAGTIVYDLLPHRVHRRVPLHGTSSAGNWALLIGFSGCLTAFLTAGASALLNADKNVVLQHLNRSLILWELGATLAAVFFFSRRQWFRLSLALLLILADMFVGFRLSFAFSFIACFTLWAESRGRQRFGIRHARPIAVAMTLIAFLFIYKSVAAQVKAGNWEEAGRQLVSAESHDYVIRDSEPFVTQAILNQVLIADFHVPYGHFRAVLYQFMFFAPSFGADLTAFNDYFQARLFPEVVDMGMANNIWAEMWSTGRWPLLALFIAFDVLLLACMSALLRIDNVEVRAALAVPCVTWAFYLHRNDLFEETNILKRLLLIGATCIVLAMLSDAAMHRVRREIRKRISARRLQALAR